MTEEILEAFDRCQRRFPTVRLPFEIFQNKMNEILSAETGSDRKHKAFARIHHEDLFLAAACAHSDRVAWEYFVDEYLPLLRNFAAHAFGSPTEGEDLVQEITAKLLNDKKRLAGYNGRGSLAAWLRVAVSHAAVDRFRRTNRQVSLEALQEAGSGAALENTDKPEDVEEALDSRWGPVISEIANTYVRGMPARDRLLLSLYYLDGVPLKTIALQHGIHEATAYRWLERMRSEIREHVERELRKKHGLRSSEVRSLWKWVSPSSLAESVAGPSQKKATLSQDGGIESRKKSATGDESGVIDKEELR